MKNKLTYGIFLAILAAALYAVNSPFSKLLLDYMPSTLMAGFLYVGAGLGMGVIALIRKQKKIQATEESITKAELPHTLAMIVLYGVALDSILDIFFHVWVLYYLITGIRAHYKLKELPEEAPALSDVEQATASDDFNLWGSDNTNE